MRNHLFIGQIDTESLVLLISGKQKESYPGGLIGQLAGGFME